MVIYATFHLIGLTVGYIKHQILRLIGLTVGHIKHQILRLKQIKWTKCWRLENVWKWPARTEVQMVGRTSKVWGENICSGQFGVKTFEKANLE